MSKIHNRLVVIGNGPVAHKFLETFVASTKAEQFKITVFGEEPHPAYDRVHLTSWFDTHNVADLNLVPKRFYQENNIQVYLGDKVLSIDRENNTLTSEKGISINYDNIVLATGSVPFVPPIPGYNRRNCFVYRTIDDLKAITQAAAEGTVGAVIGGGLLGLEAAKALKELTLKTHVIEFSPNLMSLQVDETGGEILCKKIQELGVSVHTQKNTKKIIEGKKHVHKMCFVDGDELETDLIVFSAGIRPQDTLARQAELAVGERGGISINDNCQTSDPTIYAIGEVALWNNQIFGLIAPGNTMAVVAAEHILQTGDSAFTGADMSTKLKLIGVDVASVGDAHGKTPGSLSYSYINQADGIYKKIVVSKDRKYLLGAVLVGDTENYGNLLQMTLNKIQLPDHADSLILPSFTGNTTALGVDLLPDSAVICSCNNVTKSCLLTAINSGVNTFTALKKTTKAATGCGGCSALSTQIMNNELTKLGVKINTNLCEHFPYTRQDIYNLVRVEKIKTFDELINKHGSGHGCDICKPVVASIFSACWNEHILEDKHHALQDTNDYFMANMQKDGTYSVVPRVAGGEITPEKLIVIGNVAKKYNLYTKITGGQRIDLLGARSEQLPLIWRELINAGFESGHAYGKALRTVKSCVGSSWCRYGVQDSVTTAIALENRYKGLRSPHKLKMAVSGCTRECAEAQCKDVGIIATEKGFNMYVCGNGGMKPRHADLFASDLDYDTLVSYIDRFFMFYIRTADRLQRTSVWMDNMDGGLDYLKSVIIADKLNLCKELENEMAHIINTYQCEWKSTIENPEKVKRFNHFINSDEADNNIVFVKERQQIRPANEHERKSVVNISQLT